MDFSNTPELAPYFILSNGSRLLTQLEARNLAFTTVGINFQTQK